MNRITILLASLFLAVSAWGQEDEYSRDECTSIVVGRLASADGSVITSHTCDGVSRTWLTVEPALDYGPKAMMPIYKNTRRTAFYGDTTGVRYAGQIPQARHTYAYLNTAYPCMNEKQLAMGETTFTGPDTLRNPGSMFLIEELARIALQRCDNARDAIQLMGSLAQKYGYADGGECLTVIDKKEAWFFEILGCGKGVSGAVWAAQRVPDDEVAVSANIPRIGKIDRSNKDYFMASDNVERVAKKYGLWDGEGDFVFWKAYHSSYGDGKNFKEREYVIFNTLAPSLNLSYDAPELPFSVKPDEKVDVRKVMEILRGTYEGLQFDMTKNLLVDVPAKDGQPATKKVSPVANPWLTTDTRNMINGVAPGAVEFARTIAVAWCSHSTVIQARDWLPDEVGGICWYALDNPGESPRFPIFSGTTELPAAFYTCGMRRYVPNGALWTFRRPNRLATVAWQTNKERVHKDIQTIEDLGFEGLPEVEKNPTKENLNAYTAKIYKAAADLWKKLEEDLWMKHGRGF
ncbi:MAG: C69 family dipeptidase [Bacteroidales bacterium]|nr:C69 family dipeptidase [Bacteroidales bacterium]